MQRIQKLPCELFDLLAIRVGKFELLNERRRTSVHAHHDRERVPLILPPLNAGECFGAKESLGEISQFHRRAIKIRIDPIPCGLVGGEAGEPLDIFLSTLKLREATHKRIKLEIAGELPDILSAGAQFR